MSSEARRIGSETQPRAAAQPKKRRTQAERRDAAHRRMIRAAIRLIARKGYSQTTLAQVGIEAGYSSGLVSHHFRSKEGLLRELVRRIAVRFYQDQLRPATDAPSGLGALEAMIDIYIDELQLRPERMRALYVLMGEALGPLSEIGEVFAELNRELRGVVAGLIERGQGTGEIRSDIDVGTEAATYVALLRGIANQWMAEPQCIDLDAVRRSLKHAVRRHLVS
jgi:AcrR family transcriptional regulator